MLLIGGMLIGLAVVLIRTEKSSFLVTFISAMTLSVGVLAIAKGVVG